RPAGLAPGHGAAGAGAGLSAGLAAGAAAEPGDWPERGHHAAYPGRPDHRALRPCRQTAACEPACGNRHGPVGNRH
ncbi:hypothetical protein ABTH93_21070, partial [Acinetobacter baumannii]